MRVVTSIEELQQVAFCDCPKDFARGAEISVLRVQHMEGCAVYRRLRASA